MALTFLLSLLQSGRRDRTAAKIPLVVWMDESTWRQKIGEETWIKKHEATYHTGKDHTINKMSLLGTKHWFFECVSEIFEIWTDVVVILLGGPADHESHEVVWDANMGGWGVGVKCLSMVTLCHIRNETDNFSWNATAQLSAIAQSAAEWKKQALKECVLTRWIWVLKTNPFSCALLFDSVPAVHGCPCLHS